MDCTLKNKMMVVVGPLAALILAVIASLAAYKTHSEPDSELFFKHTPRCLEHDWTVVMLAISACALPLGQKNGKAVKLSTCDSCHSLQIMAGNRETL